MDVSRILTFLETSSRQLKDAARAAGDHSKSGGPDPVGWNAVQCVEHVGLVEERFLARIKEAERSPGARNEENEIRVHAMAASRDVKVAAPEATHPSGRFQTVDDALLYFETARAAIVRYLTEHADELCSPVMQHARFGTVNGLELICIAAGHASRHALQIREMNSEG